MKSEQRIPLWFFIGALLGFYGLLILGTGVYRLVVPPEHPLALANLHADIWWGGLMLIVGVTYCVKFPPSSDDSSPS